MGVDTGYSVNAPSSMYPPSASGPSYQSPYPAYSGRAQGSFHAPIDLTGDSNETGKKNVPGKRKAVGGPVNAGPSTSSRKRKVGPGEEDEDSPPKKKAAKPKDGEKRLRVFRKRAPQAYGEIRHRALTQRMIIIDRERTSPPADIDPTSPDNHPTETVSLAGTTGNIYRITISRVPSCDCPHARKGNQCKHVIYVLHRVLRVREDLEYQLAFLSSELREIFSKAPPLPSEVAKKNNDDGEMDGNRKSLEGEDCPVCMEEFETDGKGKPQRGEDVVYCKAACGNNIHKDCFKQWAVAKKGQGHVTCPFCRSPWQDDEETGSMDLRSLAKAGKVNAEGYVNVARQLGLSGRRDYSTYNEFWMRNRVGDEW